MLIVKAINDPQTPYCVIDSTTDVVLAKCRSSLVASYVLAAIDGVDADGNDVSGDEPDDSMDGDFDSGMASAGFGTDEDYGSYGHDEY